MLDNEISRARDNFTARAYFEDWEMGAAWNRHAGSRSDNFRLK